jgi:phospholipid/cholesterol/gamma-HCH transport system substrate-binding protein
MNDRKMQFLVGVVVLFTVLIALILVMINGPVPTGWLPWGPQPYYVKINFPEAPGVSPGTPVHKNGLLVGRVASVTDMSDHVQVTAAIDKGVKLYSNTECVLRVSVLGDATIEFISRPPKPGEPPPTLLADGAVIEGHVQANSMELLSELGADIKRAANSVEDAGDEVAKAAKTINETFGTETEKGRVSKLIDKTDNAMDQFAQTMTSVNEILGGSSPEDRQMRQRLKQGLSEVPDTIHDARVTMRNFNVVLESADKNLHNLEGFTEPLGRNGENIANALIESIAGLDKLVEEFTVLTQALNNREGTLGQLIHNPELYNNLNQLTCNANYVLARINDLTARLRPVVEDARVFMDKIAREPGRLVGGALNRGPGIK